MAKKKDQRAREKRKADKQKRRDNRARAKSSKGAAASPEERDDEPEPSDAEPEIEEVQREGRGMTSMMRGFVRGDVNKRDGTGLMKRRSLTEWAIIFGVLGGAYFLYTRFAG